MFDRTTPSCSSLECISRLIARVMVLPLVLAVSNAGSVGAADAASSKPAMTATRPAYVGAPYALSRKQRPSVAELTSLGRAMFFDPSLSASGTMACAGCHSPEHAYGPPNDLSVQLGGRDMKTAGTRAVPSLRYVQNVPPFTEHFHDDDGDDSVDAGPTGGHDWDGRASSAHEQARGPLLSAREMANTGEAEVVAKLKKAGYAGRFRELFGAHVFDDVQQAFQWAVMALEVFQESPAEFYPYDSKYDAYLRGKARLTAQEQHGLALFNDPAKGNCAVCHISRIGADGALPQFTDFGYIALGVPRNREIPVNRDPAYHDLGLCGPERVDLVGRKEYCGLFRTPSLRNVATRHSFFHNGVFHNLEDVLKFYVERDTRPEKWYARNSDGSVRKFDDLPSAWHDNVNADAPFGRRPGDPPVLSDQEIKDVIAFLGTLTDGYRP